MAIRYTRLVGHEALNFDSYLRWAKGRLPVAFLRQQLVLLAIVFGSLLLLILTTFFSPSGDLDAIKNVPHQLKYGVIVDCGSSGSRAHIFTWLSDSDRAVKNIDLYRDGQNKPYTKHISPGLSSLSAHPDQASEYMEPVMDFISETIPRNRHLDTPVYFMATAGMRLLDESTQRNILADITRDLRVKYDFPILRTQVITGEYEGIYSWLSLNMDRLNESSATSRSLGMIEMGGASLQVTFELDTEIEQRVIASLGGDEPARATFRNEQVKLNLYNNHSVKLFATTFLGLGVNSARESAVDLLVRDYLEGSGELGQMRSDLANYKMNLSDPCLTMGSQEQLMRPSELLVSKNQTVGFIVKQQEDAFSVNLAGTGNFLNCLTLLERVIKAIRSERLNCIPGASSCPMSLLGTTFIPYAHYPFVGLSEMFFTTNEMIQSAGLFNRSHILAKTRDICGAQYDRLKRDFAHKTSYEDRILYECFKASWLLTVLHNSGLKMPVMYDNFRTLNSWNGQEIDWTFGAMLWKLKLNDATVR